MVKAIRKYGLIYKMFLKSSLMAQMEYRTNFIMGILVETAFLFVKMLYIIVVYQTNTSINGLTPDAILMFIGTYTIMTGLYWGFFAVNFEKIPEYIRTGALDLMITKPVSLQFISTLRNIEFGLSIPNMIGGISMVLIGWVRLGIPFSLLHITGFILFLFLGLMITYMLFLLPQLISFWVIKARAVNDISSALWDFNNMPMTIYSSWVQKIGVYMIPLFLITNFPTLFILNKLDQLYFVWAFISPILLLLIVRVVWTRAVRNYNSTN